MHRTRGGFTASDTVGLVVEYAPATGETRVRFPDGVVKLQMKRPIFLISCHLHVTFFLAYIQIMPIFSSSPFTSQYLSLHLHPHLCLSFSQYVW